MPHKRRHDPLADALQANRDLRNQLHQVEQPLRERLRDLENERDRLAQRVDALERESACYRAVVESGVGLLSHLLSGGKRSRL